ncbi:MAG: diguanylate cyclase [Clostridiales bacterium]|nr:diguanylate cyclase [Clostridiales bacterium]
MKRLILTIIIITFVFFTDASIIANAKTPDFYKMVEGHGSVMLIINPNTGEILYANESASDFYGYSIGELQSMSISELNVLSEVEIFSEMQDATKENRNYFVFKHKISSGEIKTVEVFSYPYYDGEQELLFSIIHDITERVLIEERENEITLAFITSLAIVIIFLIIFSIMQKRNNRKLKLMNEEIRNYNELRTTFINALDDLIYLKDSNFKYVLINKAVAKFYNKDESQIINHDDFDISVAEFAQKRRITDIKVIEKTTKAVDEIEWQDRIYKTIKFPIKLLDGEIGIGAYVRDVTEEYKDQKIKDKTLQRNMILMMDVMTKDFETTEEQLDFVLHECLKITESHYGYIYLYDKEGKEFILNSWTKNVMPDCSIIDKKTVYKLEKTGIWGEVVRQGKPIVVNDFDAPNSLKKGYPEGHVIIHKFMSIPVIISNRIVAVVGLANKKEDYTDNDVYQIVALMNGVWNAKERREALIDLKRERKKYLQTLLSIGDAVIVVDKNGKIEMLNEIAQKLTGWDDSEAIGKHYIEVFKLSCHHVQTAIIDPVEEVFKTGDTHIISDYALMTSRYGTKYFIEDSASPIKDEAGNIKGVVLVFRDVTEKKIQRDRIEFLSYHDSLTGVYNRRFYEETIRRLDNAKVFPLTIIMTDINGFKFTNDLYGHSVGDKLLKSFANILKQECRNDDLIARIGGDEFIIILPDVGKEYAEDIVNRIKKAVSNTQIDKTILSVSIGFASKTHLDESIEDIYKTADENMYRDKLMEKKKYEIKLIDHINSLFNDIKNEETHSENVCKLSKKIGKTMNLSERELDVLELAAQFHDIGKVAIDSKLLEKTTPLNNNELRQLKRHPHLGFTILVNLTSYINISEIVLCHHERPDGKGYPNGLKDADIPLESKIISVAEAYDVMTSEFSYKKRMTKEEAIKELIRNSGTQFDKSVVEAFIESL